MRVGQPLEPVLDNLDRVLDAWQSGGVRGLVVGRLLFEGGHLAYTPNPTVYRKWEVPAPPEPADSLDDRRQQLTQLIDRAKGRGWPVYLFDPARGGFGERSRQLLSDETERRAYLARLEDVITQFPQADGVILDGPEWGYEIAEGHRANLFDDLGPEIEPAARALGFDYARLVAAKDRLHERLHKLNREAVNLAAGGGMAHALQLIGHDPGVASWFAFRQRALTGFYRQVHQLCDALTRARNRQVKLGISPRLPAFMPLCGYELPGIASLFDLILP